jgi:hypothetical protein
VQEAALQAQDATAYHNAQISAEETCLLAATDASKEDQE